MHQRCAVVLVGLVLGACSSSAKSGPSASASGSGAPRASASAAAASAAPSPSGAPSAESVAKCPEGAIRGEDPPYCLTLDREGHPKPPEPDGPWMTTEIGPQAVLSTSKSATMADAVAELRKQWGTDAVKKKAHYEEKADGAKTVVRYLKIDPTNDPEGREANAILVVFMSSGGYTIRCEIDGGMTSESVCLSLSVPGGS